MIRALALAFAVAACSLWPSAISREQAIEIAQRHAAETMLAPVLTKVREGRLSDFRSGGTAEEMDLEAWAITFSGDLAICPPEGECAHVPGSITVFVERLTGRVDGSVGATGS